MSDRDFEAMWKKWVPYMATTLRQHGFREDAIEDVLSMTCILAYKHRANIVNPKGWLAKTALSQAATVVRQETQTKIRGHKELLELCERKGSDWPKISERIKAKIASVCPEVFH